MDSPKVDFPRIDANSRILIIVPTTHLKFENDQKNVCNEDVLDCLGMTEWTERVVSTIQRTSIQMDLISIENETNTINDGKDQLISDDPDISKHETYPTQFSTVVDHVNSNKGGEYFRKIFDSIQERMEHHAYSLLVFIGINFGKVTFKLVKAIRKALSNKTTRVLIESCKFQALNNCSADVAFEYVSPSKGIMVDGFKEELVYFYKKKEKYLETFDLSVDAVKIAAISYTLAIGVPFEKIPGLLSAKTIYETAIKNIPLNTVGLIKKCGRVLYDKESLIQLKMLIKQAGKTLALTTGCFDIFHAGHADMLKEAKDQADVFIVALNSDDSVRMLKGNNRPICNLQQRMFILLSLKSVDFIVVFNERRPEWVVDILDPDVFVKGPEYTEEALRKSLPQLKNIHITANTFDIHTSTIVEICKK